MVPWCVSDSHMFPIVDFRWVTISKTDGFFLITWNTWRTKSLFVFIHTFIYKITLCEMVNNHILIACVTKKAQNHIYNITISKVTYVWSNKTLMTYLHNKIILWLCKEKFTIGNIWRSFCDIVVLFSYSIANSQCSLIFNVLFLKSSAQSNV